MRAREHEAERRIGAIRAFNRFYTRKIGLLRAGHLGSDLSLTEVRVLYELAQREQLLAADLVRELELDAGYVSRIVARFQKKGWLTRRRSSEDARKAHLALTERGRKAFGALDVRQHDEIGALLAPLPAPQQVQLQHCLETAHSLLSGVQSRAGETTLREHRPGDIGWIVQKHGELYAREYGWNQEFEALVAEICTSFLRSFDPSGERCWIAERDGVAAGCIMLVRHSRTVAKLRLLLVDPQHRGQGVGELLVDECLRFARACGYRKIVLWTQSVLVGARRIYEAKGFRLVGTETHERFGPKLVGETWELPLAADR